MCEFVPEFAKRAGPRALIYHDPATTHAAIVNCGGLCPGINDVIRSVVTTLETGYGVTDISGIRFGFGGFWKEGVSNLKLTRSNTSGVQRAGGSVIGTGRGGGDVPKIVDSIERQGINMVFVIGGNRSHAGADAISDECARRAWQRRSPWWASRRPSTTTSCTSTRRLAKVRARRRGSEHSRGGD